MTLEQMLELSHRLQPWRPDDFTLWLRDEGADRDLPFCPDCADWHETDDLHSYVEGSTT